MQHACLSRLPATAPATQRLNKVVLAQVVAAVLHLGNIQFAPGGADDTVLADQASQQSLHIVANLLQVGCNINLVCWHAHRCKHCARLRHVLLYPQWVHECLGSRVRFPCACLPDKPHH